MRSARTLVAVRRFTRIAGARAGRIYDRARRDRNLLLAAAVAIGILFMVIHWG